MVPLDCWNRPRVEVPPYCCVGYIEVSVIKIGTILQYIINITSHLSRNRGAPPPTRTDRSGSGTSVNLQLRGSALAGGPAVYQCDRARPGAPPPTYYDRARPGGPPPTMTDRSGNSANVQSRGSALTGGPAVCQRKHARTKSGVVTARRTPGYYVGYIEVSIYKIEAAGSAKRRFLI